MNNLKIRVILMFVFAASILLAQSSESPHKILLETERCASCHVTAPTDQPGFIYLGIGVEVARDISKQCLKCHESVRHSHPIDQTPSFPTPADLPLTSGELSCSTCHYAHGSGFSDRQFVAKSAMSKLGGLFSRNKKHRTYFLRRNNSNGGLCIACHNN